MKTVICLLILATLSTTCLAATIVGDAPICQTAEAVNSFTQAQLFKDVKAIEEMIASGECQFVEPEIKATILDNGIYPKVLVYIPYKAPKTGYTTKENIN